MADRFSGLSFLSLFTLATALSKGEFLDLSYELGESTRYLPGRGKFELEILSRGSFNEYIPWLELNRFAAQEHGGTHIDAPAHLSQGKLRLSDIPLSRLVCPAVRIDITEQAKANRDYGMTAKDLQDWEEIHGKIPDGALFFVYTGWGAFYKDPALFFGTTRNDSFVDEQGRSQLHFPGVAADAAQWLVTNRKISGLGIDTASFDIGPSNDYPTHQILFAQNIYGIEMVANLDQLPNTGAKVHALPMKIKDGSGGPIRIVAVLDDTEHSGAAGQFIHSASLSCILCLYFILCL